MTLEIELSFSLCFVLLCRLCFVLLYFTRFYTTIVLTLSFVPFRNPAYFSTPNTRTDMYPPLGNLSITSARQDDHSSFQVPFSAGRPVDLNSVTPSRPTETYSPYSAGVPVTKSSPPKVRSQKAQPNGNTQQIL